MEGFVALIRTTPDTLQPEELIALAVQALQSIDSESGQPIQLFMNDRLAFAWRHAAHATDTVTLNDAKSKLFYLNGVLSLVTRQWSDPPLSFADGVYIPDTIAILQGAVRQHRLDQLSGSFQGFLHADDQTTIVCDRLGSRPIFQSNSAGLLCLASDIRLLLALPMIDTAVDLESLAQLVRTQMILEDRTLYRSISILPAATSLRIDHRDGTLITQRYWALTPQSPFRTRSEAIEATACAFRAATQRLLRDSSRVAVLLSGGLDSRMLMASLGATTGQHIHSFTFGPAITDEGIAAQRVAGLAGIPWEPIFQTSGTYLHQMPAALEASNGMFSLYHMHTFHSAGQFAMQGFDTALDGWGLDLLYSGSYLPKEYINILGRPISTYRLKQMAGHEVHSYLHRSLDVQQGDFSKSLLDNQLQSVWKDSTAHSLERMIGQAQLHSDIAYDWVDYVLFGCGVANFRSYPMLLGIRAHLRQRNPLFEADIIDTYQRLPYEWRFLGPIFRQALLQLNPDMARLVYSNLGISPLAPPVVQALSLHARATWRANSERAKQVLGKIGIRMPPNKLHGSYPETWEMAQQLSTSTSTAQRIRNLLTDGMLAKAGLINSKAIAIALQECKSGHADLSLTLMTLATIALWVDTYPARLA